MSAGTSVLVQRETELGFIARWLDETAEGSGRVALVLAGAGLGKTSLLREAATLGRSRAMTVLAARGGELEREMGFGMARQLFETAVRGLDEGERAAVVSGAAEAALPAVNGEGQGDCDAFSPTRSIWETLGIAIAPSGDSAITYTSDLPGGGPEHDHVDYATGR